MTDQATEPIEPSAACQVARIESASEADRDAIRGGPPRLAEYGDRNRSAASSRHPHPEPRLYHTMLRTWSYAWWKPLAGVAVFLVLMLAVQVVMAGVLIVTALSRSGSFTANLQQLSNFEDITPVSLLVLNLSLGSMALAAWAAMRLVHQMRPRWLTSVMPKMRWRLFALCLALGVAALVAQFLVGLMLPVGGAEVGGQVNEWTRRSTILGLVVLLTTPLQIAGEEYAFRGYLLQAIGSFWSFSWAPAWVSKWIAIVGTATLFALAHGVQNFPLFFDRFAFGLVAGWLVIYTGGLEAGLALHLFNNYFAFGLALVYGDVGQTLTVSEVSWWNIPLTLTQSGVYTLLVVLVARRMGLRRCTLQPRGAGTYDDTGRQAGLAVLDSAVRDRRMPMTPCQNGSDRQI